MGLHSHLDIMTISDKTAISKLNGYAKHTSLKIKHIYLKLLLFISETPFTFQKNDQWPTVFEPKKRLFGRTVSNSPAVALANIDIFFRRPTNFLCLSGQVKKNFCVDGRFLLLKQSWNSPSNNLRPSSDHRQKVC